MKKGDFILVYGTLRRGERADLAKQQHNFGVSFRGNDAVNGLMYHLGAYPGVKITPAMERGFDPKLPIIRGELFLIREPSVVAILDAYEGYDSDSPERGLYNRFKVETEKSRMAWIYTYNPPVTEDQRIESGDWCKAPGLLIRERRLRA